MAAKAAKRSRLDPTQRTLTSMLSKFAQSEVVANKNFDSDSDSELSTEPRSIQSLAGTIVQQLYIYIYDGLLDSCECTSDFSECDDSDVSVTHVQPSTEDHEDEITCSISNDACCSNTSPESISIEGKLYKYNINSDLIPLNCQLC